MNCKVTISEVDDVQVFRYVIEVTPQECMDMEHPTRAGDTVTLSNGRCTYMFRPGAESVSNLLATLALSVAQIERNEQDKTGYNRRRQT